MEVIHSSKYDLICTCAYTFKRVMTEVFKECTIVAVGMIIILCVFPIIKQAEYVEGDIEYVGKSLKETVVPEVS